MPDAVLLTRRSPLPFILALAIMILTVAGTLYLSLTRAAITGQQKLLSDEVASLQARVNALREQKVEAAQTARNWLSKIEKEEMRWSGVISSLQKLVPLDVITQKPKIQFLSYSGIGGGRLTMSAQTMEGSADPFADVAELLMVFNNASFFKDAYVPSLTRSTNQAGNLLLNFSFEIVYREDSPKIQRS